MVAPPKPACKEKVVEPLSQMRYNVPSMKRSSAAAVLVLLSVLAAAQPKPVIAVLDFKTSGVSEREMKSIISLLSNSLFKTGKFTVIDVAQREALLKEIEFSLSDCVEEICQIEIGKQLSAELIVVGSIDKIGSSLVLASKTLETQSGRTVSVADGMYHDLEELVRNIGKLGSELAGAPSAPDESKKRVGAVRRPAPPGFVLVKAGTFQMGSADGDSREKPVHSVTISRDFYMSQHEVTQKQWQQLMGNNPTKIKGSSLPVEQVTWYAAVEYCNRLSREEGLTSCYSGSGDDIACDHSPGRQKTAQRTGPVRHDRQRMGVVLGLVRTIRHLSRSRSPGGATRF
jgi:hypothetical protein